MVLQPSWHGIAVRSSLLNPSMTDHPAIVRKPRGHRREGTIIFHFMRVCPQGDYLTVDNDSRETTTVDHHHCDIVGAAYRHVHFSFKQC